MDLNAFKYIVLILFVSMLAFGALSYTSPSSSVTTTITAGQTSLIGLAIIFIIAIIVLTILYKYE
jgi:TRAP-type C4-dicarboxylate transport system permease small subunit